MSWREDLLALTRAALSSIANVGFVKRAEKDLETGPAPSVELAADGTVHVTFADGVKTGLPSGRGLRESPCSCGATPMCRHRVAAVLAYQSYASAAQAASSTTLASVTEASAAPPLPPWSPADVDDAALEKLLGASALARAAALRRRGVLAEVRRGDFERDDLPAVHLATSTVRFLVPRDVGHARCDCTLRTGCEHVAIAVWAFRAARAKDADAAVLSVELGDGPLEAGATGARPPALDTALAVAGAVLLEGVAHGSPASATRFALARGALERAGLAWPLAAVEELEALVSAYQRRSARYSSERTSEVVAELYARARAAAGHGELPVRAVLGSDEALEARLDQLRLTGLGARVHADGDDRLVEVYFADPSSSSVLVLERRYTPPSEGSRVATPPDDGPALALKPALAGTPLGTLALGQLVSNAAVRRANRTVSFSTGGLRKTSVLRGAGDLDVLPPSLLVADVSSFAAELRERPPRFLRPRRVADGIVAIRVGAVVEVAYDEAAQAVAATCEDVAQNSFEVTLSFRAVAPGAVAALARALSGELGAVRGVIGQVHVDGALRVDPIAVATAERFVVLDLEAEAPEAARVLAALPHVTLGGHESPISELVARVTRVLDEAVHQGLREVAPSWRGRIEAARARAADLGLSQLARELAALDEACAAAKVTGADEDERAWVEAWVSAKLRASLLGEQATAG